jgi:hypothetical protein
MKTTRVLLVLALLYCSCTGRPQKQVIEFTYTASDIQKQFDTLYNYQRVYSISAHDTASLGFVEQALAECHSRSGDTNTVQNVLSSMYLNHFSGNYDCVTSTVFTLPDGTVSANGIFTMPPGTSIAPDHDFPITGGSGKYRHIYGTYTRRYENGTYYVKLVYYKLPE